MVTSARWRRPPQSPLNRSAASHGHRRRRGNGSPNRTGIPPDMGRRFPRTGGDSPETGNDSPIKGDGSPSPGNRSPLLPNRSPLARNRSPLMVGGSLQPGNRSLVKRKRQSGRSQLQRLGFHDFSNRLGIQAKVCHAIPGNAYEIRYFSITRRISALSASEMGSRVVAICSSQMPRSDKAYFWPFPQWFPVAPYTTR